MTTTTTDETAAEPADAPQGAEQTANDPAVVDTATDAAEGADEADGKGDKSEAKLRKRAQAAEAERDALTGTVEALRKQLAAAALTDVLAKPDALWTAAGADVADYFGEDGTLDAEALREAGRAAITEYGLGAAKRFQGSADGGARGEGVVGPEKRDPFAEAAEAIRGRRD